MHVDHVGWNTRLHDGRWVPMFPNAKYIFSKKELQFWEALPRDEKTAHFVDSVLPIVEAGQAVLVENNYALNDEVWLEPTPGHTPDHVSVRLSSNGAQAVITGDMIHSPVQCLEPEWVMRADTDPVQACQTRRAFLDAIVRPMSWSVGRIFQRHRWAILSRVTRRSGFSSCLLRGKASMSFGRCTAGALTMPETYAGRQISRGYVVPTRPLRSKAASCSWVYPSKSQ